MRKYAVEMGYALLSNYISYLSDFVRLINYTRNLIKWTVKGI